MATITFNSNFDPNPGFEEILDPGGTLAGDATTFTITNNTGGALDDYIFRLTGTGFTYNGSIPTGGSVTGVQILAAGPGATTIATITGIPNRSLDGFYNTLVNSSGGALGGLLTLLNGQSNVVNGSNGADHLLAFGGIGIGGIGDTLTAGAGDDLLWYVEGTGHTMIGGTGNDTFRLDVTGGAIAAIHGSAQNGTGGAGETDIIEVRSVGITVGTVTNIDGVNFVGTLGFSTVAFSANNVNNGLASNLVVQGSAGVDILELDRTTASAVNISLANWQFDNFSVSDQVRINLTSFDADLSDIVVGSLVNDQIQCGSGNDTLSGGGDNDLIQGGTGNDILDGGADDDNLSGGADNDILDGGTGGDQLDGGTGNDMFVLGSENDSVTDTDGTDTITSTITRSLVAFSAVENLTLGGAGNINGTGNGVANVITGNGGANTLLGLAANDRLIGLGGNDILDGGVGIDRLEGGAGNDTYTIDSASEVLVEVSGIDLVRSSVTKTLATGFENLTLLLAGNINGVGNASVNVITGNGGANTLLGLAANDRLIGLGGNDILDGGVGIDRLEGGAGNDTYTIDSASEVLVEVSGIDLVRSSVTKTLATGFENLTLLLAGNINGVGNASVNVITGNGGANTLLGLAANDRLIGLGGNDILDGGVGIDRLEGGAGNDTYTIDSASEVLVEVSGIDLVRSSVTKTLATGFENLTLLLAGNINGVGNASVNVITGNSGANTLLGLAANDRLIGLGGNDILDGGVGIDRLEGGAGNDTYTIDSASEVLVEVSGIDLVRSSVTKTLATGFENLTLLLAGNISGTGNTAANVLTGNSGANTLTGLSGNDTLVGGSGNDALVGGIGKDTMTGAAGADKFDFNLTTESVRGVNRDTIVDFVRAQGDKIDLSTIDADTDGTVGNQAFAFIGTGAFTGVDGQLRCSAGIVHGDTNGDRIADFEIKVNLATLIATDFLL